MPHVNFSLPTALLAPLRGFLDGPRGARELELLVEAWARCAADEEEQSLWRLLPEPLGLPSRVEARRQQAQERLERLAEQARASEQAAAGGASDAGAAAAAHRSSL